MSSSRVLVILSTLVVLILLSATCQAQSTTLYFTYITTNYTYPFVCTTGILSCTVNAGSSGANTSYTCPTVASGVHYYYPAFNVPTYQSNLLTTAQPALCEQYTADFQVPTTTAGFNIAYGTTAAPVCVNLRTATRGGITGVYADPDAKASFVNFTFGLSPQSVGACPGPVAATSSGTVNVGFVYTVTGGNPVVCGAGNMACTTLGNNQYICNSLTSGTEYRYNPSSNSNTSVALTSLVECNGFGDGYLPLDYKGISFAGAYSSTSNCNSWYGTSSGKFGYNYNVAGNNTAYQPSVSGGTANFTYTTNNINPLAACYGYFHSSNTDNSSPSKTGATLLSLLAAVVGIVSLLA